LAEREIIFIFAENLSKKHSMARENENSGCFVVTFPLKTEKWQEDRIDKILNLLTVRYHEKQNMLLDRYIHLSHSPEFKEAKDAGLKAFRDFMNEHNFTKFDVEKVFSDSSLSKSVTSDIMLTHGINSSIMQELSHRAWSAWEKKLYGQGKFIRLDNEVNLFKSRSHKGNVTGFEYSFTDMTLSMNATKPKKHTMFTIPFIVNRKSEYEAYALGCEVRNIAIMRQQIRGKNKYYVQFTFAGVPYNKGRKMGNGIVGIDPGPSKIAIVSDNEIRITTLAPSVTKDEKAVCRLQRKLDRSRRATNPDNYNDDGTIKRGMKLKFEKSNSYKRTQAKLADMQRKLAAKRKIDHNILANEIITMGNEFHVENNSFKSMQVRSKETKKNDKGKNLSKKRFGKSLANRAPSELLTILKNKVCQYADGEYVDIPSGVACTQFDFTNGEFTKHELKERTITTSDGFVHNRDALAAFNMRFVHKKKVEGKKKIEKAKENFDLQAMTEAYKNFCSLEENIKTGK
jgi:hypothetical protein